MENGSWVAFGIFWSIALILLVMLIGRCVYRAWYHYDCCRSCRKRNSHRDSEKKRTEGIAVELQAINDQQSFDFEQEAPVPADSLARSDSQTFDPLNPDSLELPMHGIHYPDPLEEVKEEEETPPGGHNIDFRIVATGYDEPDKVIVISDERNPDVTSAQESVENLEKRSDSVVMSYHLVPESESRQPDKPTENRESKHIQTNGGVPPTPESHSEVDATPNQNTGKYNETNSDGSVASAESNYLDSESPTKENKVSREKQTHGGVPDPESHIQTNATPTQDSGGNLELIEDIIQGHDKDELFANGTLDEKTGIDNPIDVEDSELRPVYV